MTTVIVRDDGFSQENRTGPFLDWDVATQSGSEPAPGYALNVPNTVTANQLVPYFDTVDLISISFPSFADGRGFSIARHLRLLGYKGTLRASGHILSDQYTMARRCGFDEVEIDATLAARQPENEWIFRANWRENSYLSRLQATNTSLLCK